MKSKGDHTMGQKLKPSEIKRKLFLENYTSENILGNILKQGMEKMIQEILEEEVTEYLGREWYERRDQKTDQGYRNGYYDRQVKTSAGKLELRYPRTRGMGNNFESRILERLENLKDRLKKMRLEMYVRGLSTRDIESTLVDENGEALLSKSSVSNLNKRLQEDYENFRNRDLSEFDVVYLFVDGVYESVKRYTNNQTLLCAWAICSDGSKQMLHLSAVASESQMAWEVFFEEMTSRGLRQPLLIISDGNKGVRPAIAKYFSRADLQRCIAHKLRNILAKLPKDKAKEVLEEIKAVYYALDYDSAKIMAAQLIDKYIDIYPSAIKSFNEDLEACLVHLKYPLDHRKFILYSHNKFIRTSIC